MIEEYITVVFKYGEAFKGKNPFKIESDFGEPIIISLGDKITELDDLLDHRPQDGQ